MQTTTSSGHGTRVPSTRESTQQLRRQPSRSLRIYRTYVRVCFYAKRLCDTARLTGGMYRQSGSSYEYQDRGAALACGGAPAHGDTDAPFVLWIWLLMQLAARAVLALSRAGGGVVPPRRVSYGCLKRSISFFTCSSGIAFPSTT